MKSFADYLSELKSIKKEYVNDKGDLVDNPETKTVSDYTGPSPKSPPNKDSAPYKAANDNVKSPTVDVEKNGLGELGDKNLKYEPNTEYKQEVIKTKTESFLNKTKNMSLADFTKYMLDECGCGAVQDEELPYVTAYTTGKFQPHPPEAIKYVVVLANKNNNILDNMVHEMKNSGVLGKVLRALLSHPEAYDELTSLLGDSEEGPGRCKLLAKSMNNSLSSFMKDQDSMYESVSRPIGFEDEDMMDDSDEDSENEEDFDSEYSDEDSEEMDDEYSDLEDDEEMDDEEMDDEEMDDEKMDDSDELDDEIAKHSQEKYEKDPNPRKLKKKFAHNHLMDALRNFNLG